MTNVTLAQSYLIKARLRLGLLQFLLDAGGYSDVIREAQEIVELALKGMLRQVGVEPPKWHDVGSLLIEHRSRFPAEVVADLETLAAISKWHAASASSRSTVRRILSPPRSTPSKTLSAPSPMPTRSLSPLPK